MNVRAALLAGSAALLMSSASSFAADLGQMRGGSIKDHGFTPAHTHIPRAFYLRGDYGWSSNDLGGMFEPPSYDLSQVSIGNSHMWGLGVGYYFSKSVRADVTLDWMSDADLRGSVDPTSATVRGVRNFGVKNMVGLVNAYYDFDMRSHFTPYIGVGVGFARNTTTTGSVAIVNCGCTTSEGTLEGGTKWNAAGALMAGVSARLHDRLHLDAGYRFLYVGDSATGAMRTTTTNGAIVTTATHSGVSVYDQHAHQFRIGVRWDIK